jgi:hypothetical protein
MQKDLLTQHGDWNPDIRPMGISLVTRTFSHAQQHGDWNLQPLPMEQDKCVWERERERETWIQYYIIHMNTNTLLLMSEGACYCIWFKKKKKKKMWRTHSLTLHERQHQPTNEPTNHNLLLLRPPLLGCEIVLLMCHSTTII